MSEEEKAIEIVKGELQDQKQAFIYYKGVLGLYSNGEVETLLNLIEKQRKEIEEYKNFKKDIVSKIMFWDKEGLPKDEVIIRMLDTLMDEVSRLEDIEDKKVEVAIDFIEAKRDKFWQDKIRETIEHYNNELEHIKNGEEFENEKPMYYWGKAALEGLLEEN